MIWFGKSLIKFCKSFINLIKLVSTRTCSSIAAWPELETDSDCQTVVDTKHALHPRQGNFC